MPDRTMGWPLVAAVRRLHHWAALLVAHLQWLFSLVLPTVCLWGAGRSPPCSPRPSSAAVPARLVKDRLRVLTYGEVTRARRLPRCGREGEVETCAVCLSELRRRDRVRVPRNCRHVFHRRCLDRWIDHDRQRTCPLCRAPLLDPAGSPPSPPPQASEQEQRCSWAVDQLLYLFGDDLLPASPSPSPPLATSSSSHCPH